MKCFMVKEKRKKERGKKKVRDNGSVNEGERGRERRRIAVKKKCKEEFINDDINR